MNRCQGRTQSGVRCRRTALEDSDYCHLHDPDETPWDRILDTPRAEKVIQAGGRVFDRIGARVEAALDRIFNEEGAEIAEEETPVGIRCPKCKHSLGAAIRSDHAAIRRMVEAHRSRCGTTAAPTENPRAVLHFDPSQALTVELIKERHRVLASIIHPDKGGSTEAMKKLNVARDALLREVGG